MLNTWLTSASGTPSTRESGISKAGRSWEMQWYPWSLIYGLRLPLEKLPSQAELFELWAEGASKLHSQLLQCYWCHWEHRIWWFKENLCISHPRHPSALFGPMKETVAWMLFSTKQKKRPPAPTAWPWKQMWGREHHLQKWWHATKTPSQCTIN